MSSFRPGPETQTEFRRALGRFATGVVVVTCNSELGPLGITANSFASVSLSPPLVLWSPARSSARFPAFSGAKHFAIHIMGDAHTETCLRFTRSGAFWDGLAWDRGPHDLPTLRDCLARFDCRQYAIHDGGDHAIVVGEVLSVQRGSDGTPLVFADGSYGRFLPDT